MKTDGRQTAGPGSWASRPLAPRHRLEATVTLHLLAIKVPQNVYKLEAPQETPCPPPTLHCRQNPSVPLEPSVKSVRLGLSPGWLRYALWGLSHSVHKTESEGLSRWAAGQPAGPHGRGPQAAWLRTTGGTGLKPDSWPRSTGSGRSVHFQGPLIISMRQQPKRASRSRAAAPARAAHLDRWKKLKDDTS